MVEKINFMGETGLLIENNWLRSITLPHKGGKIASLYVKETEMEILFQNPQKKFVRAEYGSRFEEYEACGFDEAFPNVDEELVNIGGKYVTYPDHGELWTADFQYQADENSVTLWHHCERFCYDYQKKFLLKDHELVCRYKIANFGREPFPCIWTMHCLVNVTPDMKLIFPKGTKQVQNVFANDRTGETEGIYSFPMDCINGKNYRFDRIPDGGMVKYYVCGKIEEGVCGYDYPETNTSVRLLFDPNQLPYLGCWITAGGYRGDWNCALEPCNGYYDSIGKARRILGECPELLPGEKMEFQISILAEKLRKQ